MTAPPTDVFVGVSKVDADLINSVTIRYGRRRPTEPVSPATCTFDLLSENASVATLVIGATITVETTHSATVYTRFVGRVVGLRVGRYVTSVEAVSDGLGRLARTTVPDFVADYGRIPIGEMIGQLFAVNGLTAGADPISYTYDAGETYVVADYVIPGGTALDVGQQLAAYDVAGVLWERQSGEIVYSDGTSRAYPTPSEGTLSLQTSGSFGPPAILDEWIAEQTMAGVINAAVITWGNGAGTVTLRDATSIGTWGEYAYYADMPIDSEIDAQTVASRWVANYSDPAITVTPLVIELSIPNAPIATALSAVVGTIVDFLPGPPPIPLMPDACYLEGYTETITQTGHRLELDVSDVRLSRAPQTWATVAPATTWNSVASMYPTLTWYEQIGVPL